MTFEKPKPRNSNQSNSQAINRPTRNNPPANDNRGGHGGGNRGNGGNNNDRNGENQPPIPSPWLNPENEPKPHSEASFVEYLRWMRSPNHEYKDPTKVQILQTASEKANYSTRLEELTRRTKLIAKNSFSVQCPWRIRVGGHRGPESILLPAFDALGIPYIPSSTLRGVARTQAIREIMAKQNINWKDAEKQITRYFGSVETKDKENQAGKVVFLDAYPLPIQNQNVLAVDMANNIWQWDNNTPKYSPNPNPFLSLEKPMFMIGLRLASNCQDNEILEQVKQWLISGLQAGVGSQINTGYGQLNPAGIGNHKPESEFFRVEFMIEGQLIHGRQKFRNVNQPYQKDREGRLKTDNKGNLKPDTINHPEIRPVAFKSMLRYWFKSFTLGVLETAQVQEWEATIFGGITTPNHKFGWLMIRTLEVKSKAVKSNQDEQEGILTLHYSPEIPEDKQANLQKLVKNLTWLMFHLGGTGQGARRPCYSRQKHPYLRGSTLIPGSKDSFWKLPKTPKEFQQLFQQRLEAFYQALQALGVNFNYRQLRNCGMVNSFTWTEALDINAKIIVVSNKDDENKGYALETLHKYFHQLENPNYSDAKNLCGGVKKDFPNGIKREVIPSPIWIADLGDYQVVTVFGANADPRQKYLETLQNKVQIFPL
ncbi:MAG: type III-B CRISPR module RAMP protein Cmr6 [Aphanizomenon flos-aquae KM1D3_PB]|uniref:type III-B CRISPR module RAMP protein Cmr6 n=1 Tax=Aphanizomenon flos-aquae TaxID=1176 RepID=UPI0005421B73|nr:type III-B CRISPR module RAMP protein Cmr6 [Aphanizomenon flos-aquae]KHG39794.1 CRISPR-associated protein Cmr6 [Aphanizomenon flos-aquae 2012/KM1/D3]QSV70390.1 MAG: type III-B CRISPR module RAMP protein Cmr6 [Aphanizomenon flos-aquae KM1D3_PB]